MDNALYGLIPAALLWIGYSLSGIHHTLRKIADRLDR